MASDLYFVVVKNYDDGNQAEHKERFFPGFFEEHWAKNFKEKVFPYIGNVEHLSQEDFGKFVNITPEQYTLLNKWFVTPSHFPEGEVIVQLKFKYCDDDYNLEFYNWDGQSYVREAGVIVTTFYKRVV